jgi:TatD DNase family protein
MHYVDTHAHLFDEAFQDDFDEVIQRAHDRHVDRMLIITLNHEDTMKAVEFARRDPYQYKVACAIFPEDAKDLTDEVYEQFVRDASLPEVSVLGEMGLDYHWEKDPGIRQMQRDLFIRQLELAKQLDKPVAVHSRDAMQDTYDIMKKYHHKGLLHCFAGTKEMGLAFTKLGYYIAFGGALTFKNARHSVEVTETIDDQYLLTETDCPYMAPEPVRGTRNEPANIPYILKKMAEVRGVSEEQMADTVYANYERFLNGEQEDHTGSHRR